MNKVEALAALFGGKARLAEVVERHPSIITRWCRRGKVPYQFNARIYTSGHARCFPAGWELLLEPAECPTCGKPL